MSRVESRDSFSTPVQAAEAAARLLFNSRRKTRGSYPEPTQVIAADAAVRELGRLFDNLPGAMAGALDAARDRGGKCEWRYPPGRWMRRGARRRHGHGLPNANSPDEVGLLRSNGAVRALRRPPGHIGVAWIGRKPRP